MRVSRTVYVPLVVCLAAGLATLAGQEQGPQNEGSATVARPRGSTSPAEPAEGPKIPSKFEKKDTPPEGTPNFKSNVTAVTVDVAVLDNKGRFIPNIPRGNFRILEDSVPQQVTNFSMCEAPMTVALVVEFSNRWQSYWSRTWYDTLQASWGFLESLKQEDYIAIIAYDMRSEILCDFTQDKGEAREAMRRLQIPGFSESNLYDALADTAQRMSGIEGRKAIVAITSGIDTFSKLTYDKTRKALQNAGVPVYTIGIGQAIRIMAEASGQAGSMTQMDWLQAVHPRHLVVGDDEFELLPRETLERLLAFERSGDPVAGIFQDSFAGDQPQLVVVDQENAHGRRDLGRRAFHKGDTRK